MCGTVIVTVVSIFHLSSPPMIPNVKCITFNFDGSNVGERDEDLRKLRFENGDIIPNVKNYFFDFF
jgi:hypothetical protein